ncbi:MAG TPA: DoxX family membrane protein [Opitutaceae bacterium]|nr:DoxX family membrane protein [Opitutaceae bacterium]
MPTIARMLLGLMFFVFGLNGFLNFIPPPKDPPPGAAMDFAMAMMKTGYFFKLVKGTEVLCGLLLLANRFVPLALVLLAPVVVNIVAFHVFLAPSTAAMAIVILGIELYLAWVYRAYYRPLLAARTTPS